LLSEQERRVVAYHEAGHAIVAHFTPDSDPIHKVTIVPRGRAAGVMMQRPEEDRTNYSRTYLLSRMAVALGGRAAEQVIFNEITTGAESDLKVATGIARRMVGTWGMSNEIGAVYLGAGEEHIFLGREITQDKAYSDSTAQRLDKAVREMVDESLTFAFETVNKHRDDLERLVAALLEKETIDADDVIRLLGPPLRSPSDTVITAAEAEEIIESAEAAEAAEVAPLDQASAPIES